MVKLKKKNVKWIVTVIALAMVFVTGFTQNRALAMTVQYQYIIEKGCPNYFLYKNPNSKNAISCDIYAKPTSGDSHRAKVSVYNNSNYDGTPIATHNFVGAVPGEIMHITIPKGKTYYFKVSTTTENVTVGGYLKIVH